MKQDMKSALKKIIPKKYHIKLRHLFVKFRYYLLFFLYSGTEFECPFCKGHFRKFLPSGRDIPVLRDKKIIGGSYNLNAMCPKCYSSNRERLVYLYLKNKTSLFSKSLRLLHVAPEGNLQKALIDSQNIDYLGADFNSGLAKIKMDITDIKFNNNLFDVIICSHVLEHISDDRRAMRELYRVLKPGGWAILQVPISLSLDKTYEDPSITSPEEKERIFGQRDHVRIYAGDYKNRLEESGFYVESCNLTKEFGKSFTHRFGLSEDENIHVCSKLP